MSHADRFVQGTSVMRSVLVVIRDVEAAISSIASVSTPIARDVEAEAEAGSGSGLISVEAEARKFHRFRFHIGGESGGRKGVSSAIRRRKANRESISIKK